MFKPNIDVTQIRLNCDKCGRQEPVAKITKATIGHKCCVCGTVMLSGKDYQKYLKMQAIIKHVNSLQIPNNGQRVKGTFSEDGVKLDKNSLS